jgi:hypothetical protein
MGAGSVSLGLEWSGCEGDHSIHLIQRLRRSMPLLRWLVTVLSWQSAGFDARSVHVGFIMDKVALGQVFSSQVLSFSPVNFIPLVLHYMEKWEKLIIIY